tara:strand:- start:72 stop:683 length:612 start_codon:yes stop_codon:yes gene_type:complete
MAGSIIVGGKTLASHTTADSLKLDNSVFPTGHVIQVKTYTEYKVFAQTLDNDTETLGYGSTNFGVSITPKQTGSKNFIQISFGSLRSGPGGGFALGFRIMRNSISIKHNTGADSSASESYPQLAFRADSHNYEYNNATTYTVLDETPNIKDRQIDYTLLAYRHSNSYNPIIIVNRMNQSTSTTSNMNAYQSATTSHFTVMEIT